MANETGFDIANNQKLVCETNDCLIADALAWLECTTSIKPTVDSLSKRTGLSKGAIRNRPWVKDRLKKIKADRKAIKVALDVVQSLSVEPTIDSLSALLEASLVDKALMYEEIISLQDEIDNLKRRQIIPDGYIVIQRCEVDALRNRLKIRSI